MAILPPLPNFRLLAGVNTALALISLTSLFLPIKLSITLVGAIVSDGPTTAILAPNEGVVVEVPREGSNVLDGDSIFRLKQPVQQEDLNAKIREVADLNKRLDASKSACKQSAMAATIRLREANEMDRLNSIAFSQQAISRLQLYQYRNSLYIAKKDLDDVQTRCRQEQSQLHSDILAAQDRLGRSRISLNFQNILTAPANGTVFGITVKPGQRVQPGQEVAKFTRASRLMAELRLKSSERPFVQVGSRFEITSPTYSFLPTPPVHYCRAETITPDIVSSSGSTPSNESQFYLLRCPFTVQISSGQYPFFQGMDVTARASGADVSLFQLMIKGLRASTIAAMGPS